MPPLDPSIETSRLPGIPPWLWQRAADAPHRLLMLDYDGTIAPFRTIRQEAVPHPRALDLAREIAASNGTTLAIVSGRPIQELERTIGPLPAWFVGEHGWEARPPEGQMVTEALTENAISALGEAADRAATLGHPDRLERKRAAVVLHTRGLSRTEATELEQACEAIWNGWASAIGLRLDRVNGGLELRAIARNKGTVVWDLLRRSAPGSFPVYVGDDETDEDAFCELREHGLGVRVGTDDRPTLARARLESWTDVVEFLESWLARIETESTPPQEAP